jgi:hypothetical protein
MLPDFVVVHRRALTALDILSEAERTALAAKFTALHNLPATDWAREGVLRAKPPVHFVRVDDNLVAFFSQLPDGGFLIEDVVRPETLERFFGATYEPVPQT